MSHPKGSLYICLRHTSCHYHTNNILKTERQMIRPGGWLWISVSKKLLHLWPRILVQVTIYRGLLIGRDDSSGVRILVQVTIYRRLLIGRDGHLDQSESYDIS